MKLVPYPADHWCFLPGDALLVDYFAGCGGTSQGIEEAFGVSPDIALNHNITAMGVHTANHPTTDHLIADAGEVHPRQVGVGQPVDLFWASPDCRHFSKASGGAPKSPRVRGLAWIVVKWARLRRPRVIMVENVEEFVTWGPLLADGQPDPKRKGETFRLWVKRLRQCGYAVDWKVDRVAADWGTPTTRKRFLLIARWDGKMIDWPPATHAPRETARARGLLPWRAAADCIDFSLPCPSIFMPPAEARAMGIKRPLAEATLQRIAKGTYRYTIAAADPFIIPITHRGDSRVHSIADPMRTITTANRGEMALVSPSIIRTDMQSAKFAGVNSAEEPLRTVTSGGGFAVVAAHLGRQFGKSVGSDPADPVGVVTPGGGGKTQLVAAFLEQANTGMVGHDARAPVSTIVGRGTTQRLVAAQLTHAYSSNTAGGEGDPRKPMKTVTTGGNHHYLLEHALARPFAEGLSPELRAFLVKYYGNVTGQDLAEPLHSITARARFGLVIVSGVAFQIADIGMRMLTPTELMAAQGFRRDYVLGWTATGAPVSKTDQTLLVGNSVCPPMAAAHLRANLPWRVPGPAQARAAA